MNNKILLWFLFLLNIVHFMAIASFLNTYYTAGVVEFRPSDGSNAVNENLEAYIDIITSIEASKTDLIVFPEGTLNNELHMTYVPAVLDNVIPCNDKNKLYADFLVKLSCGAHSVRKYLVINLTEKENCTNDLPTNNRPCATNGLNVFNTNVVFDREGRVISRYRKTHLYTENKNTTFEPEFGIFETDFGVTFGHFICFDLLFYTPAVELVRQYNIKHFILTSMFYSELPFLTAVQLQHAWAWGNNVSLLAAGASDPENGITGSGIFSSTKGDLVSVMATNTGIRKLIVAEVPIEATSYIKSKAKDQSLNYIHKENMSDVRINEIQLMQDPNITDFMSVLFDIGTTKNYGRICNNGFCCNYNISCDKIDENITNTVYYKYRVGVFNGIRTYGSGDTNFIKICALYACTDETVASCGKLFNSNLTVKSNFRFNILNLSASFNNSDRMLIMPNTLGTNLLPLKSNNINWHIKDNGNMYNACINITRSTDFLLTFGIYVQYY